MPAQKYEVKPADLEQLDKVFTYHETKEGQLARYRHLRQAAKDLAADYLQLCPPSRERSLAMTKLEESNMWANAAIARNE